MSKAGSTSELQVLIARHKHVCGLIAQAERQLAKLKPGSRARTLKAMLAGSLQFALLTIESEARELGHEI